jgi:hypothetical protein
LSPFIFGIDVAVRDLLYRNRNDIMGFPRSGLVRSYELAACIGCSKNPKPGQFASTAGGSVQRGEVLMERVR